MEGVDGAKIGIPCIYAPNIPTERRHLWHVMMESLPRYYNWILGDDYNMMERREHKSSDCGRGISELENITWNGLLDGFQLQDTFTVQCESQFSWNND